MIKYTLVNLQNNVRAKQSKVEKQLEKIETWKSGVNKSLKTIDNNFENINKEFTTAFFKGVLDKYSECTVSKTPSSGFKKSTSVLSMLSNILKAWRRLVTYSKNTTLMSRTC